MNKFEHVSSDGHQMSLAERLATGRSPCPIMSGDSWGWEVPMLGEGAVQ